MEELSIRSLFTTKLRQRRSQSELPHASLSLSSSSPASSLLMKEFVSQPMRTHILTASEEILCEKYVSFAEDSPQESSACMSGPFERDDDAEHVSPSENTRPLQETSSHNIALPESAHKDVLLLQKDEELQKASSCARSLDVEDMPELECADSLETSSKISIALDGVDDTEQVVLIHTQSQETVMLDHTHLQATLAQIVTPASGVDDPKQAVMTKGEMQEMSLYSSIFSEGDVYTYHMPQQHNSEEMHAHVLFPNRAEDNGEQAMHTQQLKGRVSQDMSARISTSVEATKGTEYAADDTEHVSEMSNTGVQDVSAGVYSSSQRASGGGAALSQKNVESQETLTGVSIMESSLRHHMQQGDAAEDEAAMRSFIMHRFLPAAKEVAAEHENSIASHVNRKRIEAPLPSLPPQAQRTSSAPRTKHSEAPPSPSLSRRSQRTPVARHTKLRAQQPPPRAFASSHPARSWHREDVMPFSMRSCGYFCLGLKTALFRTHRAVSASARSTSRKKSWAPHPSGHTKVADASIACETEGQGVQEEAMGGATKLQSATATYAPVSTRIRSPKRVYFQEQESPYRQVQKHDLSSRECLSSDGCANARCNSSLSQSDKAELAGIQFDNKRSTQSPHVEPVTVRNSASAAPKEQDCKVSEEKGMASCNPKRTCDCKDPCNCHCVETPLSHKLAGEPDLCSSTLQDILGGSEASRGKPASDNVFKNAWQGDDDEEDEPQFFDALSRLNSLKSNASFYTIGSPRSEYETFGREGARINHEGGQGFTDASSHFETPRASVSKTASVRSDCATSEKGTSGNVSSLSKRVGKGLKLETDSIHALSPSKLDFSAYELEPRQGETRTGSSSSFRLSSWETMNDLYPSKAATVSPVFPAKCQNNTPNALGWPFGITTYRPVGGTSKERSVEKHVVCGNVPSPPLPPSPRESWLGKAVTKKASMPSTLATLQQKQNGVSARKKLDFVATNPDAEKRWENKVKQSRVQAGHLRFSQELHQQHHPSNRKAIRPLKL